MAICGCRRVAVEPEQDDDYPQDSRAENEDNSYIRQRRSLRDESPIEGFTPAIPMFED